MIELGINIDHVATVRQVRRTYEPDPVTAAAMAELGGAGCHYGPPSRRSKAYSRLGRANSAETVALRYNLELACSDEIVQIACAVKPDQATRFLETGKK